MGEVISISRVSDLDIFSEFDSQCPAIPQDIDATIRHVAKSAVEKKHRVDNPHSFRIICVAVVLISIVSLVAVKFFAHQLASNFTASTYASDTSSMNYQWRESRESWQAYINRLQNDALIIHLNTEKKLFQKKFPD